MSRIVKATTEPDECEKIGITEEMINAGLQFLRDEAFADAFGAGRIS
jgi:hypothetical protein